MTTHAQAPPHGHDAGHAPHRNYVKIWAILLTLITAFGVALVKAYMVAKNFMHLDVEKPIVHWMLLIALALMVLFYAGISPDVEKHHGENWKKTYVAPSPAPEHEPHGSHH
jgi:membrane protein YdbS with pleckstrin-like domain